MVFSMHINSYKCPKRCPKDETLLQIVWNGKLQTLKWRYSSSMNVWNASKIGLKLILQSTSQFRIYINTTTKHDRPNFVDKLFPSSCLLLLQSCNFQTLHFYVKLHFLHKLFCIFLRFGYIIIIFLWSHWMWRCRHTMRLHIRKKFFFSFTALSAFVCGVLLPPLLDVWA